MAESQTNNDNIQAMEDLVFIWWGDCPVDYTITESTD